MQKIQNWFDGKKTIIGILVGAIYSSLISLGYLNNNDLVWTLIIAYTGVAYKLGLNKIQTNPVDNLTTNINIPVSTKYIPPTPIQEPPEVANG